MYEGQSCLELCRAFQAIGYHTFMFPCEIDYGTLAYYAHLVKLPMFVSMKIAFNEDAIQYNHITGLRQYFSYGYSELEISFVEGAYLQLQAMQLTKENILGCCGDETQTKFE